jgi:RNA polymerase sigma-54 factor
MYLINSIDNDGYLHRALDSISDDLAFNMGIDADIEELEQVLKIIHELEPVGVGARTLQECLLLQLNARQNCSESEKLAKKIVTDHFTEFTKKHLDKLLLKLGCTNEQLKDAIDEIVRLSPRPANLYNNDAQEIVPHITPDFILDYQNGEFSLSLNYSNIPELKVNNQYVKMIREMSESVNEKQGHETMQFVKHKIESAKWFISAIKQRHTTLMQTMQTILDYQTEYFKNGDTSKLKPMILKDVADRTGLDVSTISRVVNSKYVQTHFGILSLKTLFSEAMTTESGDEVSSHEIKEILKQYVDNEDKRHPMTDEALMNELNKKGYQIARRTVAKYREMLGIPVARLRKEIV